MPRIISKHDIARLFSFDKYTIAVFNHDGIMYFRARDVISICGLNLNSTNKLLSKYVDDGNKINFTDLTKLYGDDLNIYKSWQMSSFTFFINIDGLKSLTIGIGGDRSKGFMEWIQKYVIKSFNLKGIKLCIDWDLFNHPLKLDDIVADEDDPPLTTDVPVTEHLHEVYDTNHLIDNFKDRNVIYIGYVGQYGGEMIYKFGITNSVTRRLLMEHQNNFDTFEIYYVGESNNNKVIEDRFMNLLVSYKVYRRLTIKGHNHKELFTVTAKFPIQFLKDALIDLINRYPTETEAGLIKENGDLKKRLELAESFLTRNRQYRKQKGSF